MILIVKGRSRMREHLFFSFLVVPGVGNVRFYCFSSFPHAGNPIFSFLPVPGGGNKLFSEIRLFPGSGTRSFFSIGLKSIINKWYTLPSKGCTIAYILIP